jgi:hypothetical protein
MLQPFYQVRYYKTLRRLASSASTSIWYSEYDGRFACRQFQISEHHSGAILVAPYDLPFLELEQPLVVPSGDDVEEIAHREFERAWRQFAQMRLGEIAETASAARYGQAEYYCLPVPAGIAPPGYGDGWQFVEFVDEVARRGFDAYAAHTCVCPYDVPLVEKYADFVNPEIEDGVSSEFADGVGGEGSAPAEAIAHREFEDAWMIHALARLDEIAANSTVDKARGDSGRQ